MENDRHGAKQPHRFDPAKACKLDDPARFRILPPEEVLGLLDAPHGGLVVDFGTGTGAYALALAALRPDLRVAALDEQPAMLDYLKAKLAGRPVAGVEPVLSGTPAAAALAGRADRVLALNVLHELGDKALGQAAALLKPDGRVLFVDWNSQSESGEGPPRNHVYSPDEGAARVENFGFVVEKKKILRAHYALSAAYRPRINPD
ncbi:MAG: class I SAM-dependent methyltransferase [Elusimicrobia bacterium]|nr:class I SAM-dependent methyltransferase [Elusimicrobiota bacterium]